MARVMTLVLALILGASPVSAQSKDRTPPTTPTNLRVTAVTAYTVTLAWNPSTDNSGQFSYIICCANVSSQTVGGTATSVVYAAGLEALRSFTLRITAKDAAGNYSKSSNSVTFTTLRDVTPPTKPIVSVTDVGPTHASLAWSSVEDGPNVWFAVYKDASLVSLGTRSKVGTFFFLEPQTTYTFTVRAQDFGNNWSAPSAPLSVTTKPSNSNDVTPPTTPTNLGLDNWGEEIHVNWSQSTDDLDPQWIIRYDVYVNGVLSDMTVGSGFSIVYGVAGFNTISIVAIDTAGNQAPPAVTTLVVNP